MTTRYSIPVIVSKVSYVEIDSDQSMEEIIKMIKNDIENGSFKSHRIYDSFEEDSYEYDEFGIHYQDDKEVKSPKAKQMIKDLKYFQKNVEAKK